MKKHQFILFPVILLFLSIPGLTWAQEADPTNSDNVQVYPYEHTFTITAYYSPVAGQSRYIRGSLAADKKLNGNGTNGADGTQVYPGMIAAPKTIAFGTKMKIPGIGTVAVHDRGGAIVSAAVNGKHDRLDVWMGSGDEGLNRALQWGRRNVTVMVYGIDSSVTENIDLSSLDANFQSYLNKAEDDTAAPTPKLFVKDFGLGDKDDQIIVIKQKLNQLHYFDGDFTNEFEAKTYQSVIKFQLDYQIIDSDQAFGAGYFGPQTRSTLEKALNGLTPAQLQQQTASLPQAQAAALDQQSKNIQLAGNGLSFTTVDLHLGDSGQAVIELQTELQKLNLFGIDPTGYYGEVTEHAVFKFQQSQGLVGDELSNGAGDFGPITRQTMLAIVNNRIAVRRTIAENESKFLANK